jgi:RNAse (barnase) inhibitor barstar
MMPNRTADEMLFEYGSRLTQDQRDFLYAFIQIWEFVDRHGRNLEPLVDIYDHWINTQILEGKKSDAEFLEAWA